MNLGLYVLSALGFSSGNVIGGNSPTDKSPAGSDVSNTNDALSAYRPSHHPTNPHRGKLGASQTSVAAPDFIYAPILERLRQERAQLAHLSDYEAAADVLEDTNLFKEEAKSEAKRTAPTNNPIGAWGGRLCARPPARIDQSNADTFFYPKKIAGRTDQCSLLQTAFRQVSDCDNVYRFKTAFSDTFECGSPNAIFGWSSDICYRATQGYCHKDYGYHSSSSGCGMNQHSNDCTSSAAEDEDDLGSNVDWYGSPIDPDIVNEASSHDELFPKVPTPSYWSMTDASGTTLISDDGALICKHIENRCADLAVKRESDNLYTGETTCFDGTHLAYYQYKRKFDNYYTSLLGCFSNDAPASNPLTINCTNPILFNSLKSVSSTERPLVWEVGTLTTYRTDYYACGWWNTQTCTRAQSQISTYLRQTPGESQPTLWSFSQCARNGGVKVVEETNENEPQHVISGLSDEEFLAKCQDSVAICDEQLIARPHSSAVGPSVSSSMVSPPVPSSSSLPILTSITTVLEKTTLVITPSQVQISSSVWSSEQAMMSSSVLDEEFSGDVSEQVSDELGQSISEQMRTSQESMHSTPVMVASPSFEEELPYSSMDEDTGATDYFYDAMSDMPFSSLSSPQILATSQSSAQSTASFPSSVMPSVIPSVMPSAVSSSAYSINPSPSPSPASSLSPLGQDEGIDTTSAAFGGAAAIGVGLAAGAAALTAAAVLKKKKREQGPVVLELHP